jgi:hypothetical protein
VNAMPLYTRTRFFRPQMALEGNHQSYIEVVIYHRQQSPLASVAERDQRSRQQNGSMVMARFYFHIDDDRTHIDRVGVELPDLKAARDEAVSAAGQILRNGAAKNLWSGKPWRMWVTQSPFANEKPLFVLRFSAANE